MRVRVESVVATVIATLVITAAVPQTLTAQAPPPDVTGIFDEEPAPPFRFWATYGLGTAFVTDGGDPQEAAQMARITIERGSNSLILHYASVREAFGPASDEVHEVGALYGRSLNRGLWRVQGAVGLARLAGFECLEVEDPDAVSYTHLRAHET